MTASDINNTGGTKAKRFTKENLVKINPVLIPVNRNKPLIMATDMVVISGEYPSSEAPMPAPKASRARADPSKNASFAEILPERSRSALSGVDKMVVSVFK